MAEALILIIPSFLSLCYATRNAKGSNNKMAMALLRISVVFLYIFYTVMCMKWFGTDPIPAWMSELHDLSACLTLPFAYVAINAAIGKKNVTFTTIALFMLTAILFLRFGALSLTAEMPSAPIDTKHIVFFYNGQVIGKITNYGLVIMIQSTWIACRSMNLAKMLKKNDLHGSKEAVKVVALILIILTYTFLSVCLPHIFWQATAAKYIHLIICSFLFSSLFFHIGLNFRTNPILDANNEPVYFDRKPRMEDMAQRCEVLYRDEKIYLTPSLKLEDLAKMLDTNRTYAAELMKTHFNSTFAAYTNALRIEEAKKVLLSHPNVKMETIAGMCGFATAPTFTKVFKASTGLTPSAWLIKQQKESANDEVYNDNE